MKVLIVGGSPSSQFLAPFGDLDWEVWVHGNQLQRHLDHRVTRIFEIHDDLSEHDPEYPQWLVDQKIPLIVGDKFPIKGHKVFPQEADVLGQLTSTPAYMMALAIHEGATHIGIYGVDMAVDDHEYFKQRPSMYAWIAYAKAKGIEITIPKESSLFKDSYIEGRDWGKKPDGPFTEDSFLEMVNIHQQKIGEYNQLIQTHNGCLQAYTRLAKVARAITSGQEVKNLTGSMVIK